MLIFLFIKNEKRTRIKRMERKVTELYLSEFSYEKPFLEDE